jgi:hypothetical protein
MRLLATWLELPFAKWRKALRAYNYRLGFFSTSLLSRTFGSFTRLIVPSFSDTCAFQEPKSVRKSLNVRSPQSLKLAEITASVPFSTATLDFSH